MPTVIPLANREPARCRHGYTLDQARAFYGELVGQADRILPTQHAYQRMAERDVSFAQVLRVLRRGTEAQPAAIGDEGCWRFKYRADCAGEDVSVVVDIDTDQMGEIIAVVTVIAH